MTASIPNHSLSWDRVLPAPPALLNGHANDLLPRRSSSLLQHHLVSSQDLLASAKDRRSTVPSISYQLPSRISPIPSLSARGSQDSSASDQLPTGPLTRKRAASLMADESKTRETSPATTQESNTEISNQFCLCQPDPKIPRPRNAFILYRQHHQAAVVAKHPGLPNPEISKIIGEEWRALPTKTKSQWKALAEEEKLRHQQQYPDYRYQPRRLGRNGNTQAISSSNQSGPSGNCLRCGGKTMNPPMTPHTPGFPQHGGPAAGRVRSPTAVNGAIVQTSRRPHQLAHASLHRQAPYKMTSPPPSGSALARVRPFGEVFAGGVPPSIAEAEYRARLGPPPMSPDPKRRRFNGPGVVVPTRDVHMTSPTGGYTHGHQYSPRRMSLPRPTDGAMHPRYASQGHLQRPAYRYASVDSRDPSLTLAPLQQPNSAGSQPGSGQKRVNSVASPEAQIMSIPAINKLRLLSKAAPPLPHPGAATETRGAILAIEGSEEDVRFVTEWLADFLKNASDEFLVRAFLGPDISAVMAEAKSDEEVDMVGTQQQRYLKAISEWHWVSKEVVKFVTSQQPQQQEPEKENDKAEKEREAAGEMEIDSTSTGDISSSSPSPTSAVSPRTITQTERLSIHGPPSSPNNNNNNNDTHEPPTTAGPASQQPFPIALLPRYQLSTVDTASLAMPITDSYSATDHWQWAAALWRGCVGADVTIVVQDSSSTAGGSVGSGAGSTGGSMGNMSGGSGVEVRLGGGDVRAVVVRKGGSGSGEKKGGNGNAVGSGAIEPGSLRRVGFEIVEFLRR